MNKALSNFDIYRLLNNKTRIVTYNELQAFPTIESLLSPFGNAVILYPGTDGDIGHWTCVFYGISDSGAPIISFFDPYGISVDNEFKMLQDNETPRYLARLLYHTHYPIEYNHNKLQKFSKNINTCGKHVVNRIWNQDLPLSIYNKIFGGKNADKIVTKIIGYIYIFIYSFFLFSNINLTCMLWLAGT